jgi:hypothetical protein
MRKDYRIRSWEKSGRKGLKPKMKNYPSCYLQQQRGRTKITASVRYVSLEIRTPHFPTPF